VSDVVGRFLFVRHRLFGLVLVPIFCYLTRQTLSDGKTHPHNQTTIRPIGYDNASTMQPHRPVGDRKAHAKAAGLD